ncbi:hypothetical protein HZ326_22645 [Fusarium oxysporum f. sp. albedinis]|nr:hypothetical protein HZ326_22645 [Fusarium oxysporum f. sp. albedinis]
MFIETRNYPVADLVLHPQSFWNNPSGMIILQLGRSPGRNKQGNGRLAPLTEGRGYQLSPRKWPESIDLAFCVRG